MIWYGVHLLALSFYNLKKFASGQDTMVGEKTNNSASHKCNFPYKSCLLFMRCFSHCAFSCASSGQWKFWRCSHIAYRQRVSLPCVKTCDTSAHRSFCRRSYTAYIQRAFLQCVGACASWDVEVECKNSYTYHTWKASLLNGFACVSWGYQL